MRIIIISLLFIAYASSTIAQREVVMSQYMYNKYSINPAFAGSHESLSLYASFRKQWLSFDNSASGGFASIHSPLKNERMAIGAQIISEQYGVTQNTGFNMSYAYRFNVTNTTKLSFALSGGLFLQNNNWKDASLVDPEDPSFAYAEQLNAPWVGFGSAIYSNKYFVGFSIPSLIYSDQYNTGENKLDFTKIDYLVTAGYFFELSKNFTLNPATLLKINPDKTSYADISTTAIVSDVFIAGLTYRTTQDIVAIIGYQITQQMRVTYSLDYSLSKIATYNNGTHEIGIQFDFGYKVNTPNPKFF